MCGKRSRSQRPRWPALFLSALLASASATLAAEDPGTPTSPPPSYEWPTLSPEPTPPHDELMRRWREYDQQFGSLVTSLELFLDRLEAYGISFEQLPTYIEFLESSWKDSEKARMTEREQSRQALALAIDEGARAERSRDRWRAGAIGAGIIALVGWVAFAASMVF